MTSDQWRRFLARFSRELLDDPEIAATVTPDVVRSRWMGFAPAAESAIRELESRIGLELPSSYRTFLTTSNGWKSTGYFGGRLWAAEDVALLSERNRELVEIWSREAGGGRISDADYFVYGEGQDPVYVRPEYMNACIEISEYFEGSILLLNPEIRFSNGREWEAWDFATWYPGAYRFRSFQELMESQRRSFLKLRATNAPSGTTK